MTTVILTVSLSFWFTYSSKKNQLSGSGYLFKLLSKKKVASATDKKKGLKQAKNRTRLKSGLTVVASQRSMLFKLILNNVAVK